MFLPQHHSQPGWERYFPVINLKRCSLSSLYPDWQHYSCFCCMFIYLFEEHLDKETDVFFRFRECVCSNIWTASVLNECVCLHEHHAFRTDQIITFMECLCIMIIILVLMHHWRSSFEYLAALMRCIFILMFYFPLNGSNEQFKLVWGGLNRFKPADKCPNPSKTSGSPPDAGVCSHEEHLQWWSWYSQTKELLGVCESLTCSWYRLPTIPLSRWRHWTDVLSGRFFSMKCTERVCCTITFLLSFLYFLYIKNNKLFFKHHVYVLIRSSYGVSWRN